MPQSIDPYGREQYVVDFLSGKAICYIRRHLRSACPLKNLALYLSYWWMVGLMMEVVCSVSPLNSKRNVQRWQVL